MGEKVAEQVSAGFAPVDTFVKEAALRCEIMNDIETLDAERINQFYYIPEKEGEEDNV